jgi:hypothetical protein
MPESFIRVGPSIDCKSCGTEIRNPQAQQLYCRDCGNRRRREMCRRRQLSLSRSPDEVEVWIKDHPLPRFPVPAEIHGEEWRDVVGYASFYEVSSMGRVRSLLRMNEHYMVGSRKQHGIYIRLNNGETTCEFMVHRLVMMAFCPIQSSNFYRVRHRNQNVYDNRLINLEWRHQSQRKGRAKLNADQVREIRRLWYSGQTRKEVAAQFGVGEYTVRDILSGKTWADVS